MVQLKFDGRIGHYIEMRQRFSEIVQHGIIKQAGISLGQNSDVQDQSNEQRFFQPMSSRDATYLFALKFKLSHCY